jgi:hypothetical protein
MKIQIGNKIRYSSAAGVLTGTISNIVLSENAANQTIPWVDIKFDKGNGVRMCASDQYLKMMKVEVLQ